MGEWAPRLGEGVNAWGRRGTSSEAGGVPRTSPTRTASPPPPPLDKTPFVLPAGTVSQKVTILLLLKEKSKPGQSPIPTPSSTRRPAGLGERGDTYRPGGGPVPQGSPEALLQPTPLLVPPVHGQEAPWLWGTPARVEGHREQWPTLLPPGGLRQASQPAALFLHTKLSSKPRCLISLLQSYPAAPPPWLSAGSKPRSAPRPRVSAGSALQVAWSSWGQGKA